MVQTRERLPDRRYSETFPFRHSGQDYVAAVSFYADRRLAEIFLDGAKVGSDVAVFADDCGVLASLLLQHGVQPEAIAHSISGPLAIALKLAAQQ
jgi:hypothetical protein